MTAPQPAALASLVAGETRASFCLALLDGRAWTAGEPARHARVAPATTTSPAVSASRWSTPSPATSC